MNSRVLWCLLLFCSISSLFLPSFCWADPCPTCEGAGSVICPDCGGTGIGGYVDVHGQPGAYGCETCGGVWGNPAEGTGSPGTGLVPCPMCQGTGEVEHASPPEDTQAQETAESYYQDGLVAFEKKNWPTAISAFEKALGYWPAHEAARRKLEDARVQFTHYQSLTPLFSARMQNLINSLNEASAIVLPRYPDTTAPGATPLDIYRDDVPVTNPQIAKIMRGLRAIQVPPPISPEEASVQFADPEDDRSERILSGVDTGLAVFDLAYLSIAGKTLSFTPRVILITGKTFIAAENGADLYLTKQDRSYERALQYLKDANTAPRFTAIVRAVKAKKPLPKGASTAMVQIAKAILDPRLGNSGTHLAWNALWSPEAKRAALSRACLEVGSELIGQGTEGLVTELMAAHDPAFKQSLHTIEAAEAILQKTTDPAERASLQQIIKEADSLMVRSYQIGAQTMGTIESNYVGNESEPGLGRKD